MPQAAKLRYPSLMLQLLRDASRRPDDKSHFLLTHAGQNVVVSLKRRASARRFTLRVRFAARDAVLTIPARATLREARAFADRHAAWIIARLARLPETIPFVDGAVVPVRGVEHAISHRPASRGAVWIEAAGRQQALCVAGGGEHLSRRLHDYLKREARCDLEAAVARHTNALGLPPRGVGLRDPVSRWGSCSASGSLNFSWRLIMAPPHVLDYLAAHEVAHLVHLNHSPAFWRLTAELFPGIDGAEAWLAAHGAHLHKYGTSA